MEKDRNKESYRIQRIDTTFRPLSRDSSGIFRILLLHESKLFNLKNEKKKLRLKRNISINLFEENRDKEFN